MQRGNAPAFELASSLAKTASDLAVEATAQAEAGRINAANVTVENAFPKLQQRFVLYLVTSAYHEPSPAETASALSLVPANATSAISYLLGIQRKSKAIKNGDFISKM
jgi:hypothetical protein